MPEKYCKIDGDIKQITAEYTKIDGVIKQGTVNYPKVDGVIKPVPVGEKTIFACEEFSNLLYAISDGQAVKDGWPQTESAPQVVACDDDGNSYWGDGSDVVCYDIAGTKKWTYSGHIGDIKSICVEPDAGAAGAYYVYAGDFAGSVSRLWSFNTTCILQWMQNIGASYAVYSLAVDHSAGFIYAGTGFAYDAVYGASVTTGNFTRRYISPYGDVTGLAIDEGTPDLYIGTGGGYLLRIGLNGYVYWGSAICTNVEDVRVGHDGYGYCAMGATKKIRKFVLSNGAAAWDANVGGTAHAVGCAPDEFGNVYGTFRVAGTSGDNVVRKLNSAGVEQWTWQPYVSAQFYGVAVTPGIKAAGF